MDYKIEKSLKNLNGLIIFEKLNIAIVSDNERRTHNGVVKL